MHKCVIAQSRFTAIANINANQHHTNGTFLRSTSICRVCCGRLQTLERQQCSRGLKPAHHTCLHVLRSRWLAFAHEYSLVGALSTPDGVSSNACCLYQHTIHTYTYLHEHIHSQSAKLWLGLVFFVLFIDQSAGVEH